MDSVLAEYVSYIEHERDIFAKAKHFYTLTKEKGYSLTHVARALGRSPAYVCNHLRILKVPDLVRDGYYTGLITPTHLFTLARLKDAEAMIRIYEEVLRENWSTIRLDEAVREHLYAISTEGDHADRDTIITLREKLTKGDERARVKVIQSRVRVKVEIEYNGSLKETTNFLKRLV